MVYIVKGFTIAPTYFYRSPLPVQTIQGVDANLNGENNDLPLKAYQFTGIGQAPEEIGNCETWNCSRGAWRTQLNLRVSKGFGLMGNARIEAIAELFNVLNAKNPAFTIVNNQTSAAFMQPNAYAGDFSSPTARGRSASASRLVRKSYVRRARHSAAPFVCTEGSIRFGLILLNTPDSSPQGLKPICRVLPLVSA